MPDRLAAAAARLNARLSARAGVAAVYARGASAVELTALALADAGLLDQPGQSAVRVGSRDRDFGLTAADLAVAGLFPPADGDTVTAGGATYRVQPRKDGRPAWEWGEADRVTVRVRTTQRDEPFVRLPVLWDDGSAVLWDDGSAVLWG